MTKTHAFFLSSFILVFSVGFGLLLAGFVLAPASYQNDAETPSQDTNANAVASEFKGVLLPALEERFDDSVTQYTPQLVMSVFPGFLPEDFHGVAAVVGQYEFRDSYLWHIQRDEAVEKNDSISDAGFETLFQNLQARLGQIPMQDLLTKLHETAVIKAPSTSPATASSSLDTPVSSDVICSQDAMMCSDGTSVGRTGPNCEFAACPAPSTDAAITCTPNQREAEACIELYAPVCASYQVQCVTTPCNPVPKTYPNSCFACADQNVLSYTEGECAL